jgi:hypothetical protein
VTRAEAEALLDRFPLGPADAAFVDALAETLAAPFADGVAAGAEAIGGAIQFGPADPRAIAWAQRHATALITDVDATTQAILRDQVLATLDGEDGFTAQQLTDAIRDRFEDFAAYRAERIARTETAMAMNHGTLDGYHESGVEFVQVLDGPGCLPAGHDDGAPMPDPDRYGLDLEAQANGQIWTLDEAAEYPVGHPNCVRAFAAVVPELPASEDER